MADIMKFLYNFRKVNLKNLEFKKGKIYYKNKIYNGKAYIEDINDLTSEFIKSKWGEGINISEDKDEYDTISIGKMDFDIYEGEIVIRNTYNYLDGKLAKTIKFYNEFVNEREIRYLNKEIVVIKRSKNGKEIYKREFNITEKIVRTYVDGKLVEKEYY